MTFKQMREACWSGFKQVGMKKKGKKLVPNCVPEEDQQEDAPANSAGGGGVAGIGVGPDGEPGVHVKKKKKDDMKTHIMSFLKRFKTVKEDNEMRASEIASQASNDSELYRRQIQPIIKNLGRKKSVINSPRICDIDVLDFNKKIMNKEIILPHPRMHRRNFVLLPLFEINKDWVHPVSKKHIKRLILLLSNRDIRSIKQI